MVMLIMENDDDDVDDEDVVCRFQHKNVVNFLASFMGEKFPKELEVDLLYNQPSSSTTSSYHNVHHYHCHKQHFDMTSYTVLNEAGGEDQEG